MARKPQEFADRVKELRERLGLTQNKLAREAGLAPAALSRLLSGERPPRMEQVMALARVLSTSAVELVSGTTAESVLEDWVPRSEYDRLDRERTEAARQLHSAEATVKSQAAEAEKRRETTKRLLGRVAELERSLAEAQALASRAAGTEARNVELAGEVAELESLVAGLKAAERRHRAVAQRAATLADHNYRAWELARAEVARLQATIEKSKGDTIAVGVVTAALGGLAGAILATPAETSRSRRRRS